MTKFKKQYGTYLQADTHREEFRPLESLSVVSLPTPGSAAKSQLFLRPPILTVRIRLLFIHPSLYLLTNNPFIALAIHSTFLEACHLIWTQVKETQGLQYMYANGAAISADL